MYRKQMPVIVRMRSARRGCGLAIVDGVRDYLSRMPSMTRARVDAWRMRLQIDHNTYKRSFSFAVLTAHSFDCLFVISIYHLQRSLIA